MTHQLYFKRINWRQIFIHFLACWCFIYAAQTFSFLFDTSLVDTVRSTKGELTTGTLRDEGMTISDLGEYLIWTSIAGFLGLVVAFVISLLISQKRRWFWGNSFIAFMAIYILYRYDMLGWAYAKGMFWYAGQQIGNTTVEFLLNGMILLTIGLLIFLLRQPNQFIENHKAATA